MNLAPTQEQALCIAAVTSLAIGFTMPSDRVARLELLAGLVPCLEQEPFGPLRLAVESMLRARTHLEWSFATHEATDALVPIFKAETCRLIAALAVKRVA